MPALARIPEQLEDTDLLARAQSGEPDAMEAFCRRRFTWMRRIARLELADAARADDAVQDAMVQLLLHVGDWDSSRPFAPWLATIVRNCARQHRRRWRPWEPVLAWTRRTTPTVERDLDLQRGARAAITAFERLSPGQRQALYHVDVLGLEVAEVAVLLALAPSTVRVQLHRGRHALRDHLNAWRALVASPEVTDDPR